MKRRVYVNPSASLPTGPVAGETGVPSGPVAAAPVKRQDPVFPWAQPSMATGDSGTGFPHYFRPVTPVFPATKDCAAVCKIPFGIAVSAGIMSGFNEVDYSQSTCYRCSKCGSYLCPKSVLAPDRRSWQCVLCGAFNAIEQDQSVASFDSRPEITNLAIDMVAPGDYSTIRSQPTLLFVLDMSYAAWELGFTQQMIAEIKATLDCIPDYYRVGVMSMSDRITLFDLGHKREIVISDLNDAVFTGKIDDICPYLCDVKAEVNAVLDTLMKRVPVNVDVGHCIGNAYQLISRILEGIGGVAIVGCVGVPRQGPYTLRERNGEENALLRMPKDGGAYREVAFVLNRSAVSVHLFTAGERFCDMATIGIAPGLTGGSCHKYGVFGESERRQFHADIYARITDHYTWDATMRLRCTKGITIVRPHTNCTLKNGNLVSFPVTPTNEPVVFELAVEDRIQGDNVIFQLAFVFTDSMGRRIVRVVTFELPISNDPNVVLASIDESVLSSLLLRRSVSTLLATGSVQSSATMGQVVHGMFSRPTSFASMYHVSHALLCNKIFKPEKAPEIDAKMALIIRLRSLSLNNGLIFIYPRMFVVDGAEPQVVPLTGQSFAHGKCFLVHSIDCLYMWVSSAAPESLLQSVFGVGSLAELPSDIPELQTPENQRIHALLKACWEFSGKYITVEIIPQGSPRESIFSDILMDDSELCGGKLPHWMAGLRLSP